MSPLRMKDRIKPIDVSILSTYMGRSLTIVVTVVVVGIAISAYLAGGGPERNTISVCVPAGSSAIAAMRTYEPLRALLSKVTRRPADLGVGQLDPGLEDGVILFQKLNRKHKVYATRLANIRTHI